MIKIVNGRFDDCSISSIIRQVLLHWRYELVSDLLFVSLFMKRDRLLEKAQDRSNGGICICIFLYLKFIYCW